jgi:hypothetical protein
MTATRTRGERCARALVIGGAAVIWGGVAWFAVTSILGPGMTLPAHLG